MSVQSENWTSYIEEARLLVAMTVLVLMATWEYWRPFRSRRVSQVKRWSTNICLVFANSVLLRLVFPFGTAGLASLVHRENLGFFNLFDWNDTLEIVLALVAMDFVVWLQHWLFHRGDIFWKFHKVHHADVDLDVTSGGRFHPVEIILSFLIKAAAIVALGPSVFSVVLFEIVLNASSSFNHSNITLRPKVERWLRLFIVTPDVHRIHHSVVHSETNSNYGFTLTIWDRLFGTWKESAAVGQEKMTIGLEEFQNESHVAEFWWAMGLPFRKGR